MLGSPAAHQPTNIVASTCCKGLRYKDLLLPYLCSILQPGGGSRWQNGCCTCQVYTLKLQRSVRQSCQCISKSLQLMWSVMEQDVNNEGISSLQVLHFQHSNTISLLLVCSFIRGKVGFVYRFFARTGTSGEEGPSTISCASRKVLGQPSCTDQLLGSLPCISVSLLFIASGPIGPSRSVMFACDRAVSHPV